MSPVRVTDLMSEPAVTVAPADSVHSAVGVMLEHGVGSVVAVDPGVVGILTRSDVLRAAFHAQSSFADLTVSDTMSDEVVTIGPHAAVEDALEQMAAHEIKKLPVIDGLDLVGIVTMTDVAQHQPERVQQIKRSLTRRDRWTSD